MRFQTKVDTWLAVCLGIGMLVGLLTPFVVLAYSLLLQRPAPWFLLAPVAIWIVALAATIPQYYELRLDELFIRQGWRQYLIDYRVLRSARPVDSAWSAAVFSTRRVRIETEGKGAFLIAPRDRRLFLDELAKRAPQLANAR